MAAVALVAGGSAIIAPSAHATETIKATTTVNVRSGPGTDRAIIGYVAWGWTIEATGPAVNGWTPVDYHGRAGYVASQYFTGVSQSTPTTNGDSGDAWTTAALNVRTGPSTGYERVATLPYGSRVTLTGVRSGDFSQINYDGQLRWVCQTYLTTTNPVPSQPAPAPTTPAPSEPPAAPSEPTPPPPASPQVVGQKRAAAALNLRDAASLSGAIIAIIPNGTTLDITGDLTNNRWPVLWQGKVGWVAAEYVTELAAAGPTLPAVTGQRWTTADLRVRAQPNTSSAVITVLNSGTAVDITGTVQAGWYEIVFNGVARWVSGDYLAATKPAPAPINVTPGSAQAIAQTMVAQRGWGDDQFSCLVNLWNRESGWRWNATNPSSGAYGIPQAYPGSKMASAGADWQTNPATQITWGLGYIAQRYATPCGAWDFFQSHNWY